MKKIFAFIAVLFFAVAAIAQNPHINKPDQKEVVATVDGVTVCFKGVVAGCGHASAVDAYLLVDADVNIECYNPAGQGPNPGHSRVVFAGEVLTFVPEKNGKTLIELCATIEETVEGPNPQWTCSAVDIIKLYSVTLVINGIELDVTSYYP